MNALRLRVLRRHTSLEVYGLRGVVPVFAAPCRSVRLLVHRQLETGRLPSSRFAFVVVSSGKSAKQVARTVYGRLIDAGWDYLPWMVGELRELRQRPIRLVVASHW